MQLSDVRYLLSKRTVDDRALNLRVFDVVRGRFADRAEPMRVLELGGGCGTMVDRLLQGGVLGDADYALLDQSESCLAHASGCLQAWQRGEVVEPSAHWPNQPKPGANVRVQPIEAELEHWLRNAPAEPRFDLVVCNAVLDLVDVASVMPLMLRRLADDGLLWMTINFDGDTIFVPEHELDGPILGAYHHSMDVRTRDGRPAGDSKSGRNMFEHVRRAGGQVLEAGSSDWVVHPRGGRYPADEASFLHHIVHTVEAELRDHPEVGPSMAAWSDVRRGQIDAGELVYIAHQLDFAVERAEGGDG
jgi:hypothetical protein